MPAALPPAGDLDADTVYRAVGYALTKWESLETELCWLMAKFRDLERYSVEAVRAYSERANCRGRIQTVEDAAVAYFTRCPSQDRESEFSALVEEMKSLSDIRNNIAHGVVVLLRYEGEGEVSALPGRMTRWLPGSEFCLVPAFYNSRKIDANHRPEYIYVSEVINEYGHKFASLMHKVFDYNVKCFGHPHP